jgi:hypothetical protein
MLNTALNINASVVQVDFYFTSGYVNDELEGVEKKEKNLTAYKICTVNPCINRRYLSCLVLSANYAAFRLESPNPVFFNSIAGGGTPLPSPDKTLTYLVI